MTIDYSGFAFGKGPTSSERRKAKQAATRTSENQARDTVWARDQSRDRSTGLPLKRDDESPDRIRGQWCHLKGRRVSPAMRHDPDGQILLSAENHRLADARGRYRLKMFDPETGLPATNGAKKILFIFYDTHGNELKRRIG